MNPDQTSLVWFPLGCHIAPSRHALLKQRSINVDATLYRRYVHVGRLPKNIKQARRAEVKSRDWLGKGQASHGYLVDIESCVFSEGCVVRFRLAC